MNRGEAAFARHLESLKAAGEILRWDYEPESLRLGERCFLMPDFRTVRPDGIIEFIDVKGRKGDGYWAEEDAVIKLRVAAHIHPYRFFIAWPRKGGGWEVRGV